MTLPLLMFFCSVTGDAKAQKLENVFVSAMTETSAFPFSRYLPIHPGLEIGTTFFQVEGERSLHRGNFFLGGYTHRKIENGFYLRGEYVYTYKFKDLVGVNLPVGLGYQHSFYPGEAYTQNPESGEWEKARQIGKPHGLVNFGIGFTWLNNSRIQPFVRHENVIDIPFFNGFTTVRTFLKLGVEIKIRTK